MLAAALTIWLMFSLWLIAHCGPLRRPIGETAMALLAVELVLLAIWSYGTEGCQTSTCAPVAQAAGIAARTDVPLLAALFVAVTVLRLARDARAHPGHAPAPAARADELRERRRAL